MQQQIHNVSGQTKADRLESWPGAYRLNMVLPDVAEWHAGLFYELVLNGGSEGKPTQNASELLPFDGIFVDNVFLTQSWANKDIHGRPFYPDPYGTGKPMPAKQFDQLWRAGVLHELRFFRSLMPAAIMSGHAMDVNDPDVASIFNAISIGFQMPEVIEDLRSFADAKMFYDAWFSLPQHKPHITMMESAIFLAIGYGYGYDVQINNGSIPAPTLAFAKDFYQFMRFGLVTEAEEE